MKKTRGSGILLHITALPSRFGIGDLGPAAYRFADFLAETGQRYWQVLPLNPTDPAYDNSPYSGTSGFAQNPLLISPELMVDDGLIDAEEIDDTDQFPDEYVDFARVIPFKERILSRAYDRFAKVGDRRDFERYCRDNAWWLDDFALYSAIRSDFQGVPWNQWPDGLKRREPDRLREETERLHDRIDRIRFIQFVFMQQWQRLRRYCHDRNIRIIGDMPMYMDHNSADVWLHPEYFKLDDDLRPMFVGGVPPDYFSAVGQLWGQPVYRWDNQQGSGFAWWTQRMESDLARVDYIRIDHFRGLVAYWQVPAGSRTAVEGEWVPAPARDLLSTLARKIPCLPVIGEDLGDTDPDVQVVMQEFGIPGMRVLLLAFQEGFVTSLNIPHNVAPNCFLYTGTHDTNTVRGWVEDEATEEQRRDLHQYFGCDLPAADLPWVFIWLVMSTVANTVIFPVQDILGLGSEARMNRPGTLEGNWKWRLPEGMLTPEISERLRTMTKAFARD